MFDSLLRRCSWVRNGKAAVTRFRLLRAERLEGRCLLAAAFDVMNLVSDQVGAAPIHDPRLTNAWGVAIDPARGGFMVADGGSGLATQYQGDVAGSAFARGPVAIVIPDGSDSRPTGVVHNGTSDFVISLHGSSGPAELLFATETGRLVAWRAELLSTFMQGQIVATTDGAIYKGLALASDGGNNYLYAADFHNRKIDVFDSSFQPVSLDGSFSDVSIPADYAPFNIQLLGSELFVTYAQRDAEGEDDVPGNGHGFVDVFDTQGHLLRSLIAHGPLNSPWGLAKAPDAFGEFSNALLVGNFGDGWINAFDPATGEFLDSFRNRHGIPLHIDGLWGISFGDGISAGDSHSLYFAAGPNDEAHGLLGKVVKLGPLIGGPASPAHATKLAVGIAAMESAPSGTGNHHAGLAAEAGPPSGRHGEQPKVVSKIVHVAGGVQGRSSGSTRSRRGHSSTDVDAFFTSLGTADSLTATMARRMHSNLQRGPTAKAHADGAR